MIQRALGEMIATLVFFWGKLKVLGCNRMKSRLGRLLVAIRAASLDRSSSLLSKNLRITVAGWTLDLLVLARAFLLLAGSAVVYLAGILSYIGFEFAHLFQVSSLVEIAALMMLYAVVASIVSLAVFEVIRFFFVALYCIFVFPFDVLERYRLRSNFIGRTSVFVGYYLRLIAYYITGFVISVLTLALYLGAENAGTMLILLLPMFLAVAVLGVKRSLYSRFVITMLVISVFQIGYFRAHKASTPPFVFEMNYQGVQIDVNVLLSSSDGVILASKTYRRNDFRISDQPESRGGTFESFLLAMRSAFNVFFDVGAPYYVSRVHITHLIRSKDYENELGQVMNFPKLIDGIIKPAKAVMIGIAISPAIFRADHKAVLDALASYDHESNDAGLISAFAYAVGIALAAGGILAIKDHVENPEKNPLKDGVIKVE